MHCWSSILSLVASNNIPDTMTSLFFVSIIWKKNTHPETWCFFCYLRPWPLFYSEFVTQKNTKKKHGRNVVCVNASKQPSAEAVFGKAPKVSWKATWAVIDWLSTAYVFFDKVYMTVYYIYMISSLTRICSVHSSWIEKNWLLITVIVYRSIAVLTSCLCEKTCDVFCASLLHQPTIGCFPCSVSSMFDQRMDDQNRGMFHHLKVIDKCFFWLFFFLYPFCIRSDSVVLFTRVRFVSQHTSILK